MKLDNRRESSGGEQRQDGSLDSYPAPSSFASGEEKKKGGESDRRWHGNAIAMSDRSCQTMLSFPVSVQIRRSRNFSTRSIVTVAMNIQRNCGRNKERWRGGRKSGEKKIQLSVTNGSIRSNFHISIVSRRRFLSLQRARLPAQAIPYSCNIELLLFYHRLDLIRGKFHL